MSMPAPSPLSPMAPEVRQVVRQHLIKGIIYGAILALILLGAAGRFGWAAAWVYVGYCLLVTMWSLLRLARRNPELLLERVSAFKESAGNWDKPYVVLIVVVGPPVMCLVAGLDERFGWSARLSLIIQASAFVLSLASVAFMTWAAKSNRFFSSLVRIQKERGHTVQTGGPYRYVRHPGYVAMIVNQLTAPLILGTLWAMAPAGAIVIVMIARTAREDAFLKRELPGYLEYAASVRYRLVPGIW